MLSTHIRLLLRILFSVFCLLLHWLIQHRRYKGLIFISVFKDCWLHALIHCDNGVSFASSTSLTRLSSMSVWFIDFGITPVHSDHGKPGQNGRYERVLKNRVIR